jgi:predicted DNA-binding transcriptional regulator AlpA
MENKGHLIPRIS